jgi:hypothetical protein
MPDVNPGVRMRLAHPKELSWHFLNRMLLHIRQHAEPFLGYRGSRTMVIGTITTAGAGWPLNGTVLQIGRPCRLEMPQQHLECLLGEAGHRLSTPGTLGHIRVAWHRHLQYAIFRREISYTLNLDNVYS